MADGVPVAGRRTGKLIALPTAFVGPKAGRRV